MIEPAPPPERQDADALLYDWFKHLTSMAVLILGGIVTLVQLSSTAGIKKPVLATVLVVVALSGIMAFSGAEQIVRARLKGESVSPRIQWLMRFSAFFLALGIGGVLQMFMKALK